MNKNPELPVTVLETVPVVLACWGHEKTDEADRRVRL